MKLIRIALSFAALLVVVPSLLAEKVTLRVGHFPNITHAQALVASQLQRQGKGWFQERLGPDVDIQWFVYNAGPSAMEAIFAGSIDLTYVGPGPVLNAYLKAQGNEIRVISGAANGGSALVVQGDGRLSKAADFKGKKIATPQLGNTQDVAARVWLKKQGYRITQLGGDVILLPTANPDQLALFQTGQIDGVWTVEPWISRLELESKGKIYLEEKDAITTVLASSVKMLKEKPDLVKKFVAAHAELTQWINEHPDEAKQLVRAELKELTKRDFPAATADHAWPRLKFTSDIARATFDTLLKEAQEVGFLKGSADLSRLVQIPK
ncbi:MAG: ssuA 1 [Chthoniobacteraceae bacterium]|nr:ssuA 1 [Chthoniobacteraceae bacterium]